MYDLANEFKVQLNEDLVALIVYGSLVSNDMVEGFSDVDLEVVLRKDLQRDGIIDLETVRKIGEIRRENHRIDPDVKVHLWISFEDGRRGGWIGHRLKDVKVIYGKMPESFIETEEKIIEYSKELPKRLRHQINSLASYYTRYVHPTSFIKATQYMTRDVIHDVREVLVMVGEIKALDMHKTELVECFEKHFSEMTKVDIPRKTLNIMRQWQLTTKNEKIMLKYVFEGLKFLEELYHKIR